MMSQEKHLLFLWREKIAVLTFDLGLLFIYLQFQFMCLTNLKTRASSTPSSVQYLTQ